MCDERGGCGGEMEEGKGKGVEDILIRAAARLVEAHQCLFEGRGPAL